MGCNGMAELFAGSRVSGGDRVWLRPVRPDGRQLRPDDVDAGVPTQNWSLRYMRPQCPAHREGRAQQGPAGRTLIFLLMYFQTWRI